MTSPASDTVNTADKTPILQVRDLVAGYPTRKNMFGGTKLVPTIQDISFDIHKAETVAFVGESGSGKSTTGRAILRLLPAISGAINFNGDDITKWGRRTPLKYRKEVQAVFQNPSSSLNPLHLISHTLEIVLHRHGITNKHEIRNKMDWAMETVGLTRRHLSRFPNELSGGQQQRVAIARALLLNPQLVVCDEAVSALDLTTQGQIINLLVDLQQEIGVSYLFISHDLTLMPHIAHRVGVMHQGRLVELNDTASLYNNPQSDYTQKLLDAVPSPKPPMDR